MIIVFETRIANTMRPVSPAKSFVMKAFQVKTKLNRLPLKQRPA